MFRNVVRVWIAASVVAVGFLSGPSESHAQANMWHTYSFVNSPVYISPTYATSWTTYRPYAWQSWRPWASWGPRRPLVNWSVARPVYSTTVGGVPQTTFRPWFSSAPYATYRPVYTYNRPAYTYGSPATTTYYPPSTSWYPPAYAPVTVPQAAPSMTTPAPALNLPQSTFSPSSPLEKVPDDFKRPSLAPDEANSRETNAKKTRGPLRRLPKRASPRDRTAMHNGVPVIQTASHATPGAEVIRWRPAQH